LNRRALSPTKSETAFLENRDGALATKSEKSQVNIEYGAALVIE